MVNPPYPARATSPDDVVTILKAGDRAGEAVLETAVVAR